MTDIGQVDVGIGVELGLDTLEMCRVVLHSVLHFDVGLALDLVPVVAERLALHLKDVVVFGRARAQLLEHVGQGHLEVLRLFHLLSRLRLPNERDLVRRDGNVVRHVVEPILGLGHGGVERAEVALVLGELVLRLVAEGCVRPLLLVQALCGAVRCGVAWGHGVAWHGAWREWVRRDAGGGVVSREGPATGEETHQPPDRLPPSLPPHPRDAPSLTSSRL